MSNVHVIRPDERQGAQSYASSVERIYFEWDRALSRNDAAALLELYAPDGVIESPLIPHLLGSRKEFAAGVTKCGRSLKRLLLVNLRFGNTPAQAI